MTFQAHADITITGDKITMRFQQTQGIIGNLGTVIGKTQRLFFLHPRQDARQRGILFFNLQPGFLQALAKVRKPRLVRHWHNAGVPNQFRVDMFVGAWILLDGGDMGAALVGKCRFTHICGIAAGGTVEPFIEGSRDMGELGDDAAAMHADIGRYAKQAGIDALYGNGELMAAATEAFGDGGEHYEDKRALSEHLASRLDRDSVVLVKGSRYMRMEQVVEALRATTDTMQEVD